MRRFVRKRNVLEEERDSIHSAIDKDNRIVLCKWNDNRAVHVASNFYGVNPITNKKRYSQKRKKHIQVPRPQPNTHLTFPRELVEVYLKKYSRPPKAGG